MAASGLSGLIDAGADNTITAGGRRPTPERLGTWFAGSRIEIHADLANPGLGPRRRRLVRLEQDWILAEGRRERIRPGMRVEAEIKTGERRLIEYLLSPVMQAVQAVQEAGRER